MSEGQFTIAELPPILFHTSIKWGCVFVKQCRTLLRHVSVILPARMQNSEYIVAPYSGVEFGEYVSTSVQPG